MGRKVGNIAKLPLKSGGRGTGRGFICYAPIEDGYNAMVLLMI
jgi:hypothetical protein